MTEEIDDVELIVTDCGHNVPYAQVRAAMAAEGLTHYRMAFLCSTDDTKAVVKAVNQGIDSHLQACYCPARGDSYEIRPAGIMGDRLYCVVSAESLPVLLRRLFEQWAEAWTEDSEEDHPASLVRDILGTLNIELD